MPPTLSAELWAHVFSYVQLNPRDVIDEGQLYSDCWDKFSKFPAAEAGVQAVQPNSVSTIQLFKRSTAASKAA